MAKKTRATPPKVDRIYMFFLSVPASLLYLVRLTWNDSRGGDQLMWAIYSYVAMGLAFGLFQSLFKVRRPYLTVFLSTTLVPILVYVSIFFILLIQQMRLSSHIVFDHSSSSSIPVAPQPYVERYEWAGGMMVYMVVLSFLSIPFGIIGVVGRFLGDHLIPRTVGLLMWLKPYALGGVPGPTPADSGDVKEVKVASISANATIIVAVVSAVASTLVAIFK